MDCTDSSRDNTLSDFIEEVVELIHMSPIHDYGMFTYYCYRFCSSYDKHFSQAHCRPENDTFSDIAGNGNARTGMHSIVTCNILTRDGIGHAQSVIATLGRATL